MKKLFFSSFFCLVFGLGAYAQNTDIFLKAIETEFVHIDIDHDDLGNTYVLGRRSGQTIIKKFDSTGLEVDSVQFGGISNPIAFDVASTGNIYVAGTKNIKMLDAETLTVESVVYEISEAGLGDMDYRDLVYVDGTNKLVAVAQRPTSRWARMIVINDVLTSSSVVIADELGLSDGGGVFVRAVTSDDQGNAYMVGESGGDPDAGFGSNDGYIVKLNTSDNSYTVKTYSDYNDLFNINFNNGWLYVLGKVSGSNDRVRVSRIDTTLPNSFNSFFEIVDPNYSTMGTDTDTNKYKFSLSADALDNIFVTGYMTNGTTDFYEEGSTSSDDIFKTVANSSESRFVAKLDFNFDYQWVKTPIQSNIPSLGARSTISWDALNSRLWWSGGYSGNVGLSMQEGSDSSTKIILPQEANSQGFVAVFEPNGVFTEVVDFTLITPYGQNRVQLNGSAFGSNGQTFSLILDSLISIQTPRNVYLWTQGNGTTVETDSDDANDNVIANADTRYTFLNFSVNSVVEDSQATVYNFSLQNSTSIVLEWQVEYALEVDSNFQDTASLATQSDGSLFVEPLDSGASGNPIPSVGKHWVIEDSPVTLEIDGAIVDLSSHPGLSIRYIPYGYTASGALATQVGPAANFPLVEARQQLQEFTMSGPASVTYNWKLQYGVDVKTTNLSADALLLVDFIKNLDNTTVGQSDAEGAGVHWYDDGTTVRIGAPKSLNFSGPQALEGWINGDSEIFDPVEGIFDTTGSNPFSADQVNSGFKSYDYQSEGTIFLAKEVVLNRPARVVWNYGDLVILKTVAIGDYITFTPTEIADYGLKVGQQPTLSSEDVGSTSDTGELPTASDFIWDSVTKKFFPIRPVDMNLLWPTDTTNPARVILTVVWGAINYDHIADAPPVSLVARPPASEPDDLVFQRVAYATADGAVDDDTLFTSSQAGRTVLEFNRITPTGRGGSAQSVVEIKVVETKLWSTDLPVTENVIIGQKITSTADEAGLDTGYVFFSKARYNPFIYDRTLFSGDAIWDAANPPGPVIPVNRNPTSSPEGDDEFIVVWYDDPSVNDYFLWPHRAVRYNPVWPTTTQGLGRILMSSRFGSESVDPAGNDQSILNVSSPSTGAELATTFDPAYFEQVQVYVQDNVNEAGYNPNEEHALMAPSLRYAAVAPRPNAAYAMRENDLNVTSNDSSYTSEPYVLVQFLDKTDNEFKMKVFYVAREDLTNYPNGFSQEMNAGEPVIPYYPLGVVSGATLCAANYAREGNPSRLTYWKDHKGSAWAVSGDGSFSAYFFYPLNPGFWWPDDSKIIGDCVAWLPDASTDLGRIAFTEIDYTNPDQIPNAQGVDYTTAWPTNLPTLKVGETLTFSGGEFAADNASAPGLPGVLAWAAGEVIYDDLNPDMREGSIDEDGNDFDNYTARLYSALEERRVSLPFSKLPTELTPAAGRVDVDGTIYKLTDLSSSLQKRMFYDPLTGELGLKGFVNDKDIGDNTLTAAPPAVYVLEPNVLTEAEYLELLGVSEGSGLSDLSDNSDWRGAVDALYALSRNPAGLNNARAQANEGYTVGLQPQDVRDPATGDITGQDTSAAQAYKALGPGLALVANPGFLDPFDSSLPGVSYVTLAENNDPNLGGSPVILHIVQVDRRERYRGAVKVVLSDNVFDENIILRHTGDFAGNANDLVFDWWYRVEDGTEALPPDSIPDGQLNPWKVFPDPSGDKGLGFSQLKLKGNPQAPELLLADSLWFVRYRHKNETPENPISWDATPEIPYEWAGAGNSTPNDLDGDGLPDYQAQLAQGWVKRVLDAVNPYEARIRDFTGDAPATYASMIRQFGQRFEGPVALNPDKNVIENVGLIELYSTVLKRARDLSIDLSTPVSTPGITNALLLASTRLADFYMLLGNEAYTDAKNPMIGFGSDSAEYGSLAPTVFTFQNQLSTQIEEELALLRGVYDFKARPVYNRLFWNFTKGEGEAAYATAYNISDVTGDGFIDEDDAQALYPQGHGDAWGHYLTGIRGQYELLNNPYFNWVSRSELYSLQDIVFDVDFLDERKFAQVAAAKAKAGAEIVSLTYRDAYVADEEAQWQGYLDTDQQRAWGVEGWARRAGQGAYFDWVTANALIPSEHPNSSFTGIRKVDRTTVKDIAVVSANMNAVQRTYDDANSGFNPLGIAGNTVPFDINPSLVRIGSDLTHYEQIHDRALEALNNAVAVFDHANQFNNLLRNIENTEIDFRRAVFEEDMAYRNELIEIFGSPYAGTIGSGRVYPPGYDGPDTSLYMYVDKQVREITVDTVPSMASGFVSDINDIANSFGDFIDADFRADYAPSFQDDSPSNWFTNFEDVNYIVTDDDGIDFDSGSARVGIGNVNLPIKASGYTFEAPSEWGNRASPGQLQLHIASMIQQEAALASSIAAWDGFQGGVVRQLRIIAAQISLDNNVRDLMVGKMVSNGLLGAGIIAADSAASVFNNAADLAEDTSEIPGEFVPKNLPTGGLSVSPGDALSALRGGTLTAGLLVKATLQGFSEVLSVVSATAELTKDLIAEGLDLAIYDSEQNFALKEALVELENMVGDEGILRVEIYREQEALRQLSEEYRALLQKGARLLDEREAYNKRVAELVQRNRYQDMSFRVARNAAMQRYQEAFDLAARYVYLAAKAYDYETNLNPTDPGSAQGILADIVSARSIGHIDGGVPQIGEGGLAEVLAKLDANFSVLKGQLGLNAPQEETGRFSLRQELFRISPEATSNAAWSDQLEAAKVDNLWDIPEFRRYCRPFAAYDPNTPEPGIVIEFSSEVISRKNFFGLALAGGDNAYDPTNYATKISSVGAWFEGYLSTDIDDDLSESPRIFLIPVGTDVMAYPSDTNLGVRLWDVLDQKIPVPYPISQSNLDNSSWRPLDTLGGTDAEIRKFSSFRAYHDSGFFDESEMTFDTRLVGRSVWNTRWLLIIPGATLSADADDGLQTFIDNISDIKLFFQTYGLSGN